MSNCRYVSSNELEKIVLEKEYNIIIFGASKYATRIVEILSYKGININYYADNDYRKWNSEFLGKKVIDPNSINDISNSLVIIGSSFYEQIIKQLESLNVKRIFMLTDYFHYTYKESIEDREKLKEYFDNYERFKGEKILIKAFDGIGDNIIKLGIYNEIFKKYNIDDIYIVVYKKPVYELLKLFTKNVIYIDSLLFVKNRMYRMSILKKINGYYFKYSVNFTSAKLNSTQCALCENNTNIKDNYNNFNDSTSEYVLDSQIMLAKEVFKKLKDSNFSPKFILNDKVKNINVQYKLPENYVCVSMGASSDTRRYPIDKFIKILKYLISKNINIVLLGGGYSDDNYYSEALEKIKNKENIINLSSKLALPETLKVILMSKFYLGVDSGLAHCSYALGKKTVVIIGGGDYGKFVNIDKDVKYVTNIMECYGCNWSGCKDFKCVKDIEAEDVINVIQTIFNVN